MNKLNKNRFITIYKTSTIDGDLNCKKKKITNIYLQLYMYIQ